MYNGVEKEEESAARDCLSIERVKKNTQHNNRTYQAYIVLVLVSRLLLQLGCYYQLYASMRFVAGPMTVWVCVFF